MRSDKLMAGLVLVLIGTAFLLHNFGIIHFQWYNLFRLWPIFLLIGGVNLVLANNRSTWAIIVKIVVVLGGFALILFAEPGPRHHFWNAPGIVNFEGDDDDDDSDTTTGKHSLMKVGSNESFSQPFVADTKIALLNIAGGGTSYDLKDTTAELFNGQTKNFAGNYEFKTTHTDSIAIVNFKMRNRHGKKDGIKLDFDSDKENSVTMKLNTSPIWDINVATGATELNFDLAKFKIRNLKLSGGAAEFNVKLGQPQAITNVNVSTGVSDINISVPKSAACTITTSSGLSSNDITGFNKISDNHYETPGFAAAKNKIIIKFSGGISNFQVSRY